MGLIPFQIFFMFSLLSLKYLQVLPMLFHIEGTKFFKKGQFQGHLRQLNLEQNLG